VVVTAWRDDPDAPPPDEITGSTSRPHARGNTHRVAVIGFAIAHCKCLVRVILLTRADKGTGPP